MVGNEYQRLLHDGKKIFIDAKENFAALGFAWLRSAALRDAELVPLKSLILAPITN